jgi:hypothetical protein
VFNGLFPQKHNDVVLDVIWDLSVWHAYAKLRLHTDDTIAFHREATAELGASL